MENQLYVPYQEALIFFQLADMYLGLTTFYKILLENSYMAKKCMKAAPLAVVGLTNMFRQMDGAAHLQSCARCHS